MKRHFVKKPVTASSQYQRPDTVNPDLRDEVTSFVIDQISAALDNIAVSCASVVPGYDANYNDESGTNQPVINRNIKSLASEVALQMLYDCPFRSDFY